MGKHGIVVEADDVDSVGVGGGGSRISIRIVDDVGGKGQEIIGPIHATGAVGECWQIRADPVGDTAHQGSPGGGVDGSIVEQKICAPRKAVA